VGSIFEIEQLYFGSDFAINFRNMMDQKVAAAIAGGLVVFLTALAAGVIVKWSSEQPKRDGRSWRRPAERRYSIRRKEFAVADRNSILYDGWFHDTFRCSWQSFNRIVSLVENEWDSVYVPIHNNARFYIRERIAVCLHYLTHIGAIVDSAKVFGMGKPSAFCYIEEVLDVVIG
jgi:hypothetical protein